MLLFIAAEATYITVQSTSKFKYKRYNKPIFVDTSVLIDGRIIPIAESGFITGTLYIPRSVIGELQLLADQADHDKRTKARHGLDIVKELQALPQVKVEIFADSTTAREGVDNRLLKLAKQYHGSICTIDFNLNKVAQVEKIPVLNVNSLAMNLRMAYLPGEKVMIELTQKGNDSHQAVGHLVDGTMVVVEQAKALIGKKVEIEFIRSLQTAAGKMMFARLVKPVESTAARSTRPAGRTPRAKVVSAEPVVETVIEAAPAAEPAKASQRPRQQKRAPNHDRTETAQSDQPKQPQRPRTNGRQQSRRRTSPEDALIALANQQSQD